MKSEIEQIKKNCEEDNKNMKLLIDEQTHEIDQLKSKIKSMETNKLTIQQSKQLSQPQNIPYINNKELEGIINYLQSNSDDIFSEIDITSSSIYNNELKYAPGNAIMYQNLKTEFCTKDIENSWVCFYFIKHQVLINCYTIRSYRASINSLHPKSWVIEGSNNNSEWETLDKQNNCPFLNGSSKVYTFNINNPLNKCYRFIRMQMTNENWHGSYYLNINCIEFYGKLF